MEKLFGTSGIRRRVSELPAGFAVNLGKTLGGLASSKTVAVGRDTRSSGILLESAFISGLLSTGKNVVELGIVPTPTVGVATAEYGTGVMVTASHNPPEYNGFKFFSKKGAYSLKEEEELEKRFYSKKFKTNKAGILAEEDFTERHVDLILRKVGKCNRKIKVVLDCAGGAGSAVTPKLLEKMGCEVIALNTNRDGRFPHELEPREENLVELCKTVRKKKADIGFAHDGDADRAAAVASNGRMVEWDSFLSILAYGLDKVVTTVDASMRIEDVCKKVFRTPVGDVAVADAIRKQNADFGGEPSGTFIFPDVHIFPDGVSCIAKAVKLASEGKFYERLEKVKSYPMERLKIPCENAKKEKTMKKLKTLIDEKYSDLDGIRIAREDSWILIRPSGTEPYMRITAEGRDEVSLQNILTEVQGWVRKAMSD
ncbi:MAG: phosphoglucosamine mutase [Candidatus Altiarchaeales archaeon]|nr:phosphoglucosamine mutase [Candidatus Altiarchaeales archaeon]